MFREGNGFVLSYIMDYLEVTPDNQAFHGKIGGELEPISLEEAACRVIYNFNESTGWNPVPYVVSDRPRNESEFAMKSFADQVGLDRLNDAVTWASSIAYEVCKKKQQLLDVFLEKGEVLDNTDRVR